MLSKTLSLFSWFSFNREMSLRVDKTQHRYTFDGQNDWKPVMLRRVLAVAVCLAVGNLIVELGKDEFVFRLVGLIIIFIPFIVFVVSFLTLISPKLQKVYIEFSPNELQFAHAYGKFKQTTVFKSDISSFVIFFQKDVFSVNLKVWLNGAKKPIFNFVVSEQLRSEREVFEFFANIAESWDLNYYNIYPTRKGTGRFEFLKNGQNALSKKMSYEKLKQLSLNSQLEIGSGQTKIGSYVFQQKDDALFIDHKKNANEWTNLALTLVFSGGIFAFCLYLYLAGKLGNSIFAVALIVAVFVFMLGWGVKDLYSEYYLQYLIEPKNNVIKIRNVFLKWKEIDFDDIESVDFKGKIIQAKHSKVYFADIDLCLKNNKLRHLMTVRSSETELDVEAVKNDVYTIGLMITRIIAKNTGKSYRWYDFDENN